MANRATRTTCRPRTRTAGARNWRCALPWSGPRSSRRRWTTSTCTAPPASRTTKSRPPSSSGCSPLPRGPVPARATAAIRLARPARWKRSSVCWRWRMTSCLATSAPPRLIRAADPGSRGAMRAGQSPSRSATHSALAATTPACCLPMPGWHHDQPAPALVHRGCRRVVAAVGWLPRIVRSAGRGDADATREGAHCVNPAASRAPPRARLRAPGAGSRAAGHGGERPRIGHAALRVCLLARRPGHHRLHVRDLGPRATGTVADAIPQFGAQRRGRLLDHCRRLPRRFERGERGTRELRRRPAGSRQPGAGQRRGGAAGLRRHGRCRTDVRSDRLPRSFRLRPGPGSAAQRQYAGARGRAAHVGAARAALAGAAGKLVQQQPLGPSPGPVGATGTGRGALPTRRSPGTRTAHRPGAHTVNELPERWCVLIPCLNEEAAIKVVVESVLALGAPVIVVDDGSSDRTPEIVSRLPVTLLHLDSRHGKGEALRRGFREARRQGYAAVLTMDGDGQHLASDIPRIVAAARRYPGHIVIGARLLDREQQPHSRRRANAVADWGISWACAQPVADTQSGQRWYPPAVLDLV